MRRRRRKILSMEYSLKRVQLPFDFLIFTLTKIKCIDTETQNRSRCVQKNKKIYVFYHCVVILHITRKVISWGSV